MKDIGERDESDPQVTFAMMKYHQEDDTVTLQVNQNEDAIRVNMTASMAMDFAHSFLSVVQYSESVTRGFGEDLDRYGPKEIPEAYKV